MTETTPTTITEAQYRVATRNRYVAGFGISPTPSRDFVALVQKRSPDWQAGKWNAVGGKIEPGETPREAMSREFREETGVWVPEWKHFCTLSGSGFEVYFFTANDTSIVMARTVTEEAIELFPVQDIVAGTYRTISNVPWLLQMAIGPEHDWPYFIQEQAGTL